MSQNIVIMDIGTERLIKSGERLRLQMLEETTSSIDLNRTLTPCNAQRK